MQALMLAAGMGKRLGRLTQNATKCMVKVNGKALIEYAIDDLAAVGIRRFVMVTGYKADVLKSFLREKYEAVKNGAVDIAAEDGGISAAAIDCIMCRNGMKIEFIDNPDYAATNNIYSLYLARQVLCEDDTLLLESDAIFKRSILEKLLASDSSNLAVVSHFEPWMDGTCALLNDADEIAGMVDKASFDWRKTADYYKTVNIYKFSRNFSEHSYVPFLEAYQKAFGKNEYYEQVLKVLSFLSASSLKALRVSGDDWYEIDDPADLAVAENRFAAGEARLLKTQARYGGYWRFPNMKDFCYLVNPYWPPVQMVEEIKSSLPALATQYPSGAHEQSLLAGKVFGVDPNHIAVGNGAAELIKTLCEGMEGEAGESGGEIAVAIPYPTFNEYPARIKGRVVKVEHGGAQCFDGSASLSNHTPQTATRQSFAVSADDVIKTVRESKARSAILINPDNPSGAFMEKSEVLRLAGKLRTMDAMLLFDESFIDFAQKDVRYTLIDDEVLQEYPNLVVIKSISKSHGVPGLRLGVLASSDEELIKRVRKQDAIWNINSFGEYYLQIFDKYKKSYSAACDKAAAERKRFGAGLEKCGFFVYPSEANFLLCRLPDGCKMTATEMTVRLLNEKNIFIKDLSSKVCFEDGHHIRLAVRGEADDNALLEAVMSIIGTAGHIKLL